ncbi:prophage endopeptidase tail protein [Bacillus phage vB_Bacillus_1020A]|uniref:hypothetical protein n=1 Tax=Robertmurraya sp. DFI.2.37 TaxID=3031819 RepID=UPI0012446060|nr:hypothetical protein [Robertmurraya sp. DFI.2.37]MDF1510835.1 hypothetical protein [Robertmurraya sp. DFI.2.37]QIW89316.1 prophage endopeptidase tail protein [Bacillus phage vB_Bacillus_1020A]
MIITFTLNTGMNITANIPDFNSEDFANKLNNPQTLFISVGNNGFQKHALAGWHEEVKNEN